MRKPLGIGKIFLCFCLLSILGWLMVYSASTYQLLQQGAHPTTLLIKQGVIMLISWGLMGLIFRVKLSFLFNQKLAGMLVVLSLLLLLFVRLPVFGVSVNGAQRWISIFGLQFQPSELGNFALIYYLSCYFDKNPQPSTKQQKMIPWLLLGALCLLILLQPKVGGAILIFVVGSVMIFSSTIPASFSLLACGCGLVLTAIASKLVLFWGSKHYLPHFFTHVYNRLLVLKNPFDFFHDQGFQPAMAYLAIHNGGFFGTGLANGKVAKGGLPESDTDFIFAIIVEELGVVGGFVILFLLFFLAASIIRASCKLKNHGYGLFLLGVGTWLMVQTAINLGGVLGLMPMTGMPLPFVSYGGTSYLIFSVALAIVMKIIVTERQEYFIAKKTCQSSHEL